MSWASRLQAMLDKKRPEAYLQYVEVVAQFLTTQRCKSVGGINGFAVKQAGAAWRSE